MYVKFNSRAGNNFLLFVPRVVCFVYLCLIVDHFFMLCIPSHIMLLRQMYSLNGCNKSSGVNRCCCLRLLCFFIINIKFQHLISGVCLVHLLGVVFYERVFLNIRNKKINNREGNYDIIIWYDYHVVINMLFGIYWWFF